MEPKTRARQNGVTWTRRAASIRLNIVESSDLLRRTTMNANPSIPKGRPLKRTKMIVLASLALVAGGAVVYWLYYSNPPSPRVLRWRISHYLKAQAGTSDFSVPFKFPSPTDAEPEAPHAGTNGEPLPLVGPLTKKDFNTLKADYIKQEVAVLNARRDTADSQRVLDQKRAQLAAAEKELAAAQADAAATNAAAVPASAAALRERVADLEKSLPGRREALAAKEEAVAPLLSDLRVFQRAWAAQLRALEVSSTSAVAVAQAELNRDTRQRLEEATSYDTMYRLIGQELWVAGRLFDSESLEQRRVALRIARQAGRDALYPAMNDWLASSIYLAYVVPNLDLAEGRNGADSLLSECADIFRRTGDEGSLVQLYRNLLDKAGSGPRADSARVQLAQVYEQAGAYSDAIRYLKQVKGTNEYSWAMRRIPYMERRIKDQR